MSIASTVETKLVNQGTGIADKWNEIAQINELPTSGEVTLRLVVTGRNRDMKFGINGQSVTITAYQDGEQVNQLTKAFEEAAIVFATYRAKGYWVQSIEESAEVVKATNFIEVNYIFGEKSDDAYAQENVEVLVERGYDLGVSKRAVEIVRASVE